MEHPDQLGKFGQQPLQTTDNRYNLLLSRVLPSHVAYAHTRASQGLATKAGIHVNVLGRYERSEATPSIDVAVKLADALDVSVDYLVGKATTHVDQSLLDKVLTIQQLPDEDREHILYALDGLIQHAKTRLAYKK